MNDQFALVESPFGSEPEDSVQHPEAGRKPGAEDPGGYQALAGQTAGPPPLAELDQLVTAERLREIVWDQASRPSMQWIRKETKRRMLPHIRRGRLIFYRPRSVLEWYGQRESRPASMR